MSPGFGSSSTTSRRSGQSGHASSSPGTRLRPSATPPATRPRMLCVVVAPRPTRTNSGCPSPNRPTVYPNGGLVGLVPLADVLDRPTVRPDHLGEMGILLVQPGDRLRIVRHAGSLRRSTD